MTERQRLIALETNRLQLSIWDKFSHFLIVALLLVTPLMYFFFNIKDMLKESPKLTTGSETYTMVILTVLAVIFYKLQSNRLKFKEVNTTLSKNQLTDIIKKVGHELQWHPIDITDSYIIAKTHPSFFSGSWGEQITILFDTNRILINSICDPDKKSSLVSMGRNKKNVNRLVNEIQNASRQQKILRQQG